MESTLYFTRVAEAARDRKWSGRRTAWFIIVTCSAFWGGVAAAVWHFI